MSLVKLSAEASEAIRSELAKAASSGPIRIELQFTGCCDPSLGLLVDNAGESDIVEEVDGLTFVIDPQTSDLAGEISIDLKRDEVRDVFLLTSANPIGEWDGFVTCNLRI